MPLKNCQYGFSTRFATISSFDPEIASPVHLFKLWVSALCIAHAFFVPPFPSQIPTAVSRVRTAEMGVKRKFIPVSRMKLHPSIAAIFLVSVCSAQTAVCAIASFPAHSNQATGRAELLAAPSSPTSASPLIGRWSFTEGRKAMEYRFKADGTFTFVDSLYSASRGIIETQMKGKWSLSDGSLKLTYSGEFAGESGSWKIKFLKKDQLQIESADGGKTVYSRAR
jgi:hypothetical protein